MSIGRLTGTRAVWLLNALIALAALAIFFFVVPTLAPIEVPQRLPWWGLAVAFALCELWAVQLYFRRSAHSFTMGELALVIGLVMATPRDLVIAQLVGPALVLAWRRTPLKLVFNLGQFTLGGSVAIVVFHLLAPGSDPTGPGTWIAALAATAASGVTSVVLLAAAISLAEGRVDWREIALMLRMDAMVTVGMTCVGLAVTALLVLDARSAWLLFVPAAMLMVAYRAYLNERQRRERLDFLLDATHTLSVTPDVEDALVEMLTRSRSAFRAEFAEAVLFAGCGAAPRRTSVSVDGTEPMTAVEPESAAALRELAADGGVRVLERPAPAPELEAYLRDAEIEGPVLVAVLAGQASPLGLLLIANRPDVDRHFSGSDLELLDKLAGHVAASLEHENLEQDFGRLEQLQSQLEHMAFHDPLTNLPNRARFTEQVSHALDRRDARVAALFIDLDDFKTVNDSLGHKAGDELLVSVAERLRSCLRAHDTPARLGGDEFAVLIEDADSIDVVIEIAERVLRSLDDRFVVADTELHVRASIGVATSQDGVRRAQDLVRNADLAMYRAKSQGKGCFELFEADMHARAVQRHELKSELQRAVDEEQFVVLYQPVVDLHGGQIAGVEALVRWQHPRLGLVGPDKFIPLAEEAGLIDSIGRIVLAQACQRLAVWRRASIAGEEFRLSLNLSVREFQAPDLVEVLRQTAERSGVPTSAITLEITESALMDDLEAGVARMELIKAAGFRLALDDFGTGYSSLSHLRQFPIDVLKIAKPFVDHIAERGEDAAFLRSILDLARILSLDVIVEGVETAEQAQILLELGARKVQGFVFSRPVEDRALSALLTLTPLRGFADAPAIPAAPPVGPGVVEMVPAVGP
ncbi:MAG: EAL domain-containing protein [Actinomycetota bacterium]|nr:EAL domain-containing protein [Actinomycetota bacterium]